MSFVRASRTVTDWDTITDAEAFGRGRVSGESRRSILVPKKLVIEAKGITEHLTCAGETIIVNFHGALNSTSVAQEVPCIAVCTART